MLTKTGNTTNLLYHLRRWRKPKGVFQNCRRSSHAHKQASYGSLTVKPPKHSLVSNFSEPSYYRHRSCIQMKNVHNAAQTTITSDVILYRQWKTNDVDWCGSFSSMYPTTLRICVVWHHTLRQTSLQLSHTPCDRSLNHLWSEAGDKQICFLKCYEVGECWWISGQSDVSCKCNIPDVTPDWEI